MLTHYFEDLPAGEVFEAGSVTVSEDEIIDFARRFDPQVFHVDPVGARTTIYGGLIASGWHTVALCMRQLVDYVFGHSQGMGSPGVDEIRWTLPVRPGDTLSVRVTMLEARVSRSKPDRGLIRFRIEAHNQDGEQVLEMTGMGFMARRTPLTPQPPLPHAGEGELASTDS